MRVFQLEVWAPVVAGKGLRMRANKEIGSQLETSKVILPDRFLPLIPHI